MISEVVVIRTPGFSVELNNQIADITRQDRLLTQLKHQGLVEPDIFISCRDALVEQFTSYQNQLSCYTEKIMKEPKRRNVENFT